MSLSLIVIDPSGGWGPYSSFDRIVKINSTDLSIETYVEQDLPTNFPSWGPNPGGLILNNAWYRHRIYGEYFYTFHSIDTYPAIITRRLSNLEFLNWDFGYNYTPTGFHNDIMGPGKIPDSAFIKYQRKGNEFFAYGDTNARALYRFSISPRAFPQINLINYIPNFFLPSGSEPDPSAKSVLCSDGNSIYYAYPNVGGNSYIRKLDYFTGSLLAEIGGLIGTGNNQFSSGIEGMCTDGTYVYVSDTNNSRIKKHLCSDLSYVAKIGSFGTGNDQFKRPRGIITDSKYLYIIDSTSSSILGYQSRIIKRLSSDLSYINQVGSVGTGPPPEFGPFMTQIDQARIIGAIPTFRPDLL